MTAGYSNPVGYPGPISAWEELGRCVFSRSQRRRAAKNRTPLEVFLEKEGEVKISVDRLSCAPEADEPTREKAWAPIANARRAGEERDPPRNFYGWSVVSVEKVQEAGCDATDSPILPDNPYHADILLPDSSTNAREAQMHFASILAGKSTWRACQST